jgi:excisionase family DNA binding protein
MGRARSESEVAAVKAKKNVLGKTSCMALIIQYITTVASVIRPEISGTSAGHQRERTPRSKALGKDSMQRLLNIREVAQYIGLSTHTLYAMVSKRQIPYVKVGRLTKFQPDLLDKWLKQNTHVPVPQKVA